MKYKNELYEKEQNEIINKLIDILELEEQQYLILYNLDNNESKQKLILDLIPNIRKYFSLSNVRGIKNPETLKRPWLSIIRQMLKQKYKIISKDHQITENGKKIRTKKYIFQEQ